MAKYISVVLFGFTAISAIRPEVVAGPNSRNFSALVLCSVQSVASLLLRCAVAEFDANKKLIDTATRLRFLMVLDIMVYKLFLTVLTLFALGSLQNTTKGAKALKRIGLEFPNSTNTQHTFDALVLQGIDVITAKWIILHVLHCFGPANMEVDIVCPQPNS